MIRRSTTLICLLNTFCAWVAEAQPQGDQQRIAVVEIKNNADLREREVQLFTNTARGVIAERLGQTHLVITSENMRALIDEQTCDDMMAQSCEVEVGRKIGAHLIVSGSVTSLGRLFVVSLKVHNTKDGRLLGVREGEVKKVEELRAQVKEVAGQVADLMTPSRSTGSPLSMAQEVINQEAKQRREAEILARQTLAHAVEVRRVWERALPVVERGDAKGEQALKRFLKAYEGHALGNPLESEARAAFESARAQREAEALEAHRRLVEGEWGRLSVILKGGGAPAQKAVGLFLKRFESHPLGNPLESEARATLENLSLQRAMKFEGDGVSGIEWVEVPGGSFEMGARGGESDEVPVRTVRLRAFLMSKTEVTVGQYRRCVLAGVCSEPGRSDSACTWNSRAGDRENHPINCIDWGQARTFAKWAGGELPTEAEWEYAARGGQWLSYSGSSEPEDVAWYMSNSGDGPEPVGTKRANGYGLYDMSGNVWEWVLDEYKDSYRGASSDGHNAVGSTPMCGIRCDQGNAAGRVNRGGSWNFVEGLLRVTNRSYNAPYSRRDDLGVRIRKNIK